MAIKEIKGAIRVQVNKIHTRGEEKGQCERTNMYFKDWFSSLNWARSVNKLKLSFKVTEVRGAVNGKICSENFNVRLPE